MKIVISSGHSTRCRGASGFIDEVDEARKVVPRVAEFLADAGVQTEVFMDTTSDDQQENLNRIVDFHNGEERDLDISVHFNAYETKTGPMGTECLYVTQEELAKNVAAAISDISGLKNRGPKYRDDLFFLNNTDEPAILIEVCFCDSQTDCDIYRAHFNEICLVIAEMVSGVELPLTEPPDEGEGGEHLPPPPVEETETLFHATGKASYFGGPTDEGVSPSEGLAFISRMDQAPHLFLPFRPEGTTGLARRLNPYVHYLACRWDYSVTPKTMLLDKIATVHAISTGITLKAFPADWGPHEDTGRVADLSPGLMEDLGIETDDEVEVTLV